MVAEWLRWLRLPVAALALLSAPMAHAQPAAASPTARTGSPGRRRDPARITQLLQRIKQLSELPTPLSEDKALAILQTRKGSSREAGKRNLEWALAPTGLIAGGRIGHGTNRPYAYLEITPAPSLGLTFEDVAQLMLHAPYTMVEDQAHAFEDSLASRTLGIYHIFLVPAGELKSTSAARRRTPPPTRPSRPGARATTPPGASVR